MTATLNMNHYNCLTELPESMVYLRKLERLWLNGNRLTCLPELIGNLDWLKEFRVFDNRLERLPASVGKLTRLTDLDVCDNRLKSLPDTVGHLRRLYQLRVSNNRLQNIPDSICNLSNLHWLFLSQNKLTHLPEDMGRLQKLEGIEAHENKLTNIPASVQSMQGLRSFSLAGNPLEGAFELPYEIQFKQGDLPNIKLKFAQFFSFCGMTLPDDAVDHRRNGYVGDEDQVEESFCVAHFCFGKEGEREYLDFYFEERRSGPHHVRIYEDGEHERLPTYRSAYSYPGDATPEEKARLKAEWHKYNDENSAMLKKKFGI